MPPLSSGLFFVFFFNDTATTEIYTLSLHDALPISIGDFGQRRFSLGPRGQAGYVIGYSPPVPTIDRTFKFLRPLGQPRHAGRGVLFVLLDFGRHAIQAVA